MGRNDVGDAVAGAWNAVTSAGTNVGLANPNSIFGGMGAAEKQRIEAEKEAAARAVENRRLGQTDRQLTEVEANNRRDARLRQWQIESSERSAREKAENKDDDYARSFANSAVQTWMQKNEGDFEGAAKIYNEAYNIALTKGTGSGIPAATPANAVGKMQFQGLEYPVYSANGESYIQDAAGRKLKVKKGIIGGYKVQ
jgi:hypothetical protein